MAVPNPPPGGIGGGGGGTIEDWVPGLKPGGRGGGLGGPVNRKNTAMKNNWNGRTFAVFFLKFISIIGNLFQSWMHGLFT